MAEGNLGLARHLDAQLPAEERMEANALAMAQRHGDELIQAVSPRRGQREAALYALTLFARLDPPGAARLWESHAAGYPESEQRYGWGQVAMHAARKHDPRALEWFARAGPADAPAHSELQALWRARTALRAGRWLEVYQVIQAMPAAMQEESVWRYWKARALKALNAFFPANTLFAHLSQEHDYYGLLALEELPPRLESRPPFYRVTPDDLKEAESNPSLQRALLLRKLDLPGDALEEWNRALRGMSDRQLLAAAELALREAWHDRAIVSANLTKTEHNFDLRYIAPYRDLASTYAQENGLDEAWVYGLIRQESRFVAYARSRVGAQGLMQIMPATAKWVAKQLGLDRRAHNNVGSPETNIRFGTYYLKRIYDSLDQSPVMATAGYNAGPGRARRWQADTPLEGAIYVESIPFQETRDYVKRVMANAMFYRIRFGGEARTLKERLGVIPPRQKETSANRAEDDPDPA
jgi:soluble lytic murein transglycosylase